MSHPVVAVYGTPPSFLIERAAEHFQLVSSEHAWAAPEMIQGIISGQANQPLEGKTLAHYPQLEIIAHLGVGYDSIDTLWCQTHGVIVTHTPDVLNNEVADLALGLLLATVRQIPQADRYFRAGEWEHAPYPLTSSLHGRRLGILGLGRIGKAIAHRAEVFGLSIAYHNRRPVDEVNYHYYSSLKALAGACNILLLATPATAETRHIINTEILHQLGKDGIFINVSRGSLVDEEALIRALQYGTILAAGLDVYENEPIPNPALATLPNTVLLPHVGSATTSTRQAMAKLVVDNLQHYFDGLGPLTPIPETPWSNNKSIK